MNKILILLLSTTICTVLYAQDNCEIYKATYLDNGYEYQDSHRCYNLKASVEAANLLLKNCNSITIDYIEDIKELNIELQEKCSDI